LIFPQILKCGFVTGLVANLFNIKSQAHQKIRVIYAVFPIKPRNNELSKIAVLLQKHTFPLSKDYHNEISSANKILLESRNFDMGLFV